jgi:putative Mn2+ efflux pump MntP
MNLIGWLVGYKIAHFVEFFDHWIAFAILVVIGGKMIWENIWHKEENENKQKSLNIKYLILVSLATSMDVLAVGFSFSFMLPFSQVYIMTIIIGIIALLMSLLGAYMGYKISKKSRIGIAEILGGIILIGIGVKILLEHL